MNEIGKVTTEYRVYVVVEKWGISYSRKDVNSEWEYEDVTFEDEVETWLQDQCPTEGNALNKANEYDTLITRLHMDNLDLEDIEDDILVGLQQGKAAAEYMADATDSDPEDHQRLAIINQAIAKRSAEIAG